MSTRTHTSKNLKVYMPTGRVNLQQKRRTSETASSASTGGGQGHWGLSGVNEVQRLTITGSPTGGTFTLTFSGQTTAAIAFDADATAIQAALEALSNIAVGDVTVAPATVGGVLPSTSMDIEFLATYEQVNVAQITSSSSLTGGTTPAISITTIQ